MLTLKSIAKGTGYVAAVAVGVAVERGLESFHNYAQEHGGYKQVFTDGLRTADDKARKFGKSLDERIQPAVERAREKVRVHGKDFRDGLSEFCSCLKEMVGEVWHGYVPKKEELAKGGIYEGIGSVYKQIFLTRADCDECLRFAGEAEKRIPEGKPFKKNVIADIKRTASSGFDDLKIFYENTIFWDFSKPDELKTVMECAHLAMNYLQNPASNLSGEKYK